MLCVSCGLKSDAVGLGGFYENWYLLLLCFAGARICVCVCGGGGGGVSSRLLLSLPGLFFPLLFQSHSSVPRVVYVPPTPPNELDRSASC